MSFEGYYQVICKNGHYTAIRLDYTYSEVENFICSCGKKAIWWNLVDETNGCFEDGKRIDGWIDLKKSEEIRCKHCDSFLVSKYKIPKNKGHRIEEKRK